jgi:hypothetical protein
MHVLLLFLQFLNQRSDYEFHVRKSVHHHTIQIIQPTRCNSFTSLLFDVLCGSTCFGRLPTHHQEHTTALGASGLTVGEHQQQLNQRLLVQSYAPDDGRGDA